MAQDNPFDIELPPSKSSNPFEVDIPVLKKKVSTPVSPIGGSGLKNGYDLSLPTSKAPSILTPKAQEEYTAAEEQKATDLSGRLNKATGAFRAVQGDKLADDIALYQQNPEVYREAQKPQGGWLENAIKQGEIQGKVANILHLGERPTPDQLEEIAGLQYQAQYIPQSEAQKLYSEQGLGIFKDPIKGAQFLTETIASSLAGLYEAGKRTAPVATGIGATAGSFVPGIGTAIGAGVGAMAGLSTAGLNISTSSDILQSLKDTGVDVTDKDALIKAFSNEKKMAELRSTALKYGVPIMAFDVATAGIAGKVIGGTIGKSIAKKIAAGLGEAGIQAVGGASGEFSGQLTSGKDIDWNEVAIEGIASIATDAPDVVIGVSIERAKASSSNKNLLKQIVTQGKEAGVEDAKLNLDRDLNNGVITPEEHQEGLDFVAKVVATNEKIPAKVQGENREKSIELIDEKEITQIEIDGLEKSKKGMDEAYHETIDKQIERRKTKIAGITKELKELAVKPRTEDGRVLNQYTGKWEVPVKTEVVTEETVPAENKIAPPIINEDNSLNLPNESGPEIRDGSSQEELRDSSTSETGTVETTTGLRESLATTQRKLEGQNATSEQLEDSEKREVLKHAKENNLWVDDLYTLGDPTNTGGQENTLALNAENQTLYKSNNLSNTKNSVAKLFDQVDYHNELFPDNPYEVVGYTGLEGSDKRTPHIEVILKQDFIGDAVQATRKQISDYMESRGFTKLDDSVFRKGEFTVSDLHPRNVLVDNQGGIHVIDNIIEKGASKFDTPDEKVQREIKSEFDPLAKAESDLQTLKKVEDKTKKYEASIKRLSEAKKAGQITENEFTEMEKRFDEVLSKSAPKEKSVPVAVKEPERVSGKFYRSETGFTQDKGTTAEDVLNYEADELGNQDGIDAREKMRELGIDLSKIPHSDIIWVTKNKRAAKRYGDEVSEYEIEDGIVVVPDDGDGGMLILKNSKAKSSQEEATALKVGDSVSFINQLKEPDTGKILEIKPNGDYVVEKSNGVKNNMAPETLSKVVAEAKTPLELAKEKLAETKAVVDKIRSLKIKGKTFDATLGLPVAVWNGAVETVATAIEAGAVIADAIKRGINYIQKNHRGAWNKKAYNDTVIKELGLRGITVNGEDLIVKPQEDKATVELVNGFYSPLEKGIAENKNDKATGRGWQKILSGVTDGDEMQFTGMDQFLKENVDRVINKKELNAFMQDNRIEVVEVQKGGSIEEETAELLEKGYTLEQEMGGDYIILDRDGEIVEYDDLMHDERALIDSISEKVDENTGSAPKFSNYQLEGDKSGYKEILVTLPYRNAKAEARFKQLDAQIDNLEAKKNFTEGYKRKDEINKEIEKLMPEWESLRWADKNTTFKSSHFDEPNIILHLRMNTRVDSEGNRILFLEEIQSDWSQKARKEGFADKFTKESIKIIGGPSETNVFEFEIGGQRDRARLKPDETIGEWKDRMVKAYAENNMGVPKAPFVTDTNAWVKLGLKTALKEAVAQKTDKIAWTTGEQQNSRYDLSQQVDRIEATKVSKQAATSDGWGEKPYDGEPKYNITVHKKGGGEETLSLKENELEANLGKDLAEKIIKDGGGDYSGLDLKVGGKGMKGFYGSPEEGKLGIVGEVAKSLFKQDVKTTEVVQRQKADNVPTIKQLNDDVWQVRGEENVVLYNFGSEAEAKEYVSRYAQKASEQHSVDITPDLVNAVKEGLPLYTNALTEAKAKLAEAKANLDSLNKNLGVASGPEQKAKALYEYHKALVNVAKEYIKVGIKTVKEFAEAIGEKIADVQAAWDEATGGKELKVTDFEESDPILSDEEANILGITKKERQRERANVGEEQYEYDVKHRNDLEKEADKLMLDGFSVPNLIKKLQTGRYFPTDTEMELVRRYYISLTAKINKAPAADLLVERKLIQETLDKVGTSMGRGVQAFDGLMAIEDNLAAFLGDESVFKELSPEEIAELSDKYNKAKEALEQLQAKTEGALADALEKEAQKQLIESRKRANRASVKEDFKTRKKTITEDIRAKLREIRNTPQAIILPYARELIAIAPLVRQYVDVLIEEKIYDLKEIVKSIHGMLKDDIEDITEGDVRDIIAGEYPNPRKTRNAKMAQIQDLKRQAQLEATIERLEAGVLATKSPVEKKTKNDKILELEKEIALIKKRNPELTAPAKQQARKTWYANRIKELKDEIAKGDFDPLQPNPPVLLDAEALKLKDEYAKFVSETRERRQKQEYEATSLAGKLLRRGQQLLGVKRLVQTSLDLSIPLRQGVAVMLNPRTTKTGVEAYGKMLNQVFSEKNYNRMMHDIRADGQYLESKDDGIVYTEVSSKNPEMRDESHPHESFVYKLLIFGPAFRASERAAAAWTNYARTELYKRGANMLAAQGKTRENAKQAYEDMAARVMVDTGRGKVPGIADKTLSREGTVIKQLLGLTFYGARLYSSTFRKLNPLYYFGIPNPLNKGYVVDKSVRIEALKDMAGYVTSQILLTTAIAAATGAVVSLDWDDPDFMKLRWGKRVIDLTAGQSVYIRTFLRLLNAVYNRADPTINKGDADKYADFAKKSLETFWRNKLAPNTAYGVNAFMGSNTIGEKFDPYEIIRIYPMYTDDIVTSFKEGRPTDALVTLPVGILGLGYQEYSRDIRQAKVSNYFTPKDKELTAFLKKHQINVTGDINQEVYDLNVGEKVKMTKEQSDRYEQVWAESVIGQLKTEMPELDKMAAADQKHVDEKGYDRKLNAALTKIKTEARNAATEVVTGVPVNFVTLEDSGVTYRLTPDQIKERLKLNQEYIKDYGSDILSGTIEGTIARGETPAQARRSADRALKQAANKYSKGALLTKYSDGEGRVTLLVKE